MKSQNFPQKNVSSQEPRVGLILWTEVCLEGEKKSPAPPFHFASWLCLACRERLMRTLIKFVSMASSRLLARPEKILLIWVVGVPVDGGRERTKSSWPKCATTYTHIVAGGGIEQSWAFFTRLGTGITLRERESGTFKVRWLPYGKKSL